MSDTDIEYVNAAKAAKLLAVSTTTVMRWLDDGLFPNAYKISSTIRIPVSDIEALKKQRPEAS